MPTLEVQSDGLHLTTDQLEKLGWQPGQRIELFEFVDGVILRPVGTADRSIIRAAMRHLENEVGFNTGIERPRWANGRFEVRVFRSFDRRDLGMLVFDADGILIPEVSTPSSEMRELADAP